MSDDLLDLMREAERRVRYEVAEAEWWVGFSTIRELRRKSWRIRDGRLRKIRFRRAVHRAYRKLARG